MCLFKYTCNLRRHHETYCNEPEVCNAPAEAFSVLTLARGFPFGVDMDEFGGDAVAEMQAEGAVDEWGGGGFEDLEAESVPAGRPRGGRPRMAGVLVGPLVLVMVVSSSTGLWADFPPLEGAAVPMADGHVVGAYIARWRLCSFADARAASVGCGPAEWVVRMLLRSSRRSGATACLVYEAVAWGQFQESFAPVASLDNPGGLRAEAHHRAMMPPYGAMAEFLDMAMAMGAVGTMVVAMAGWLAVAPFAEEAGAIRIFHGVPITRRFHWRRTLDSKPAARDVADYLATIEREPPRRRSGRDRRLKGWPTQHRAAVIVEWVEFSSFITDVKQTLDAAKAAAKLFARGGAGTREELSARLIKVGMRLVRQARVRVDAVAMLCTAKVLEEAMTHISSMHVYMFCDGSPQWRGLELYASTFDFIIAGDLMRILAPVIFLARGQLDAVSKTAGLLWQLCLVCGSKILPAVLSRVRAILTDGGVERFIGATSMVLGDLYWFLREPVPDGFDGATPVLPRAIRVLGWKHQWDLTIRKGLNALPWFPHWLQLLKKTTYFLRDESLLADLRKHLKKEGKSGVASMLKNAHLPNFAHWRWSTLDEVCVELGKFLTSLRASFKAEWFKQIRDKVLLKGIVSATSSDAWEGRFHFVAWYAAWLSSILRWGGGCPCHAPDDEGAKDCQWKGRRLPEVWDWGTAAIRSGLREAESWVPGRFGSVHMDECQGAVRAAFSFGMTLLENYDRIPLLMARLDVPGVRDRCLEQWASAPPERHDFTSAEFLSETAPASLRGMVARVQDDGVIPDSRLRDEVEGVKRIPIDDTVNESPHALASRISAHARRGRIPWIASSMRLKPNLGQIDKFTQRHGEDALQQLWLRWKDALPGGGPRRMNKSKVERGLYTLEHLRNDDEAAEEGGGDVSSDDDEGDAVVPVAEEVARVEEAAPEGGPLREPLTMKEKLLRQWLVSALKPYKYYSVPDPSVEGGRRPFMVLSLEQKTVTIPTWYTRTEGSGKMSIRIQPFEVWRSEASYMEVFEVEEPCKLDLLALTGGDPSVRSDIMQWSSRAADVEGCLELHAPELARPTLKLSDANAPKLSLLDALHEGSWEAVPALVRHAPGVGKQFDCREGSLRVAYLQCLLAIETIMEKRPRGFPSGKKSQFYEWLLRDPTNADEHLSAKDCKKRLSELTGDVVESAMLSAEAPPAKRPRSEPLALGPADEFGGGVELEEAEVGGAEGGGGLALAEGDEGAHRAAPSSSSGGDSDSSSDSSTTTATGEAAPEVTPAEETFGGDPADEAHDFPVEIDGQRVGVETHADGSAGLRINCNNPAHGKDCRKYRSVRLETEVFGHRAAEFFLGAWLEHSFHDELYGRHSTWKPGRAMVRAYAAAHQEAASGSAG